MKLSYGTITSLAVLVYITLGAGSEIYYGLHDHEVKATLLFIALSAVIFVTRIFYAYESGAKKTLYADYYGAVVLTLLLILKLYYS
jgi:CDP-diglyceride synthetase